MKIKDVAKATGIPVSTLYRMIRQHRGIGQDFVYQPGKGYRFIGELKEEEK